MLQGLSAYEQWVFQSDENDGNAHSIGKTCPCNVYPLKPHFYIVKLGHAGVYLFFLFLLQNINV